MDQSLPGADLIRRGLVDLAQGVESLEALLVSIGADQLRALGFAVSAAFPEPEHRLYRALSRENSDSAHARYNALIRRLVSFEHSVACVKPLT